MANLLLSQTRQLFCSNCFKIRFSLKLQKKPQQIVTFSSSLTAKSVSTCFANNMIKNWTRPFILERLIFRKNILISSCRFYHFSNFRHFSPVISNSIKVRQSNNTGLQKLIPNGNHFHSTPRRLVSPVIWMVLKPIAKIIALLGGRRFRFWFKQLPTEEKKLIFTWQNVLATLSALLGFGTFYYVSHLQETPITKRIRFIAFTDEQFMKIANFEAKMQERMNKNLFLPATHPSYLRVIRIMERLVHQNWTLSNMKTQKWKVAIIDSFDINACVLATGHVYVHAGLLNFVQNDDQLAIVLAHEIAHNLLGHMAEKVSFAQILDYFVIIMMAAIWAFMPFDGIALITQAFYEKVVEILLNNPYSRKLEREADVVGLELAAKACFDVREGTNFWKLMQFSEKLDGTETPEWLSTHPSNVKRQEIIEHYLPKALGIREKSQCPPLSKKDPRNCLKDMEKMIQNVLTARLANQNLSKLGKQNQ